MTQVRHFDDITDADITTKFIGSVIHTQGTIPGENALGCQERFVALQKKLYLQGLVFPYCLQ
jgi:beta-glucosidase